MSDPKSKRVRGVLVARMRAVMGRAAVFTPDSLARALGEPRGRMVAMLHAMVQTGEIVYLRPGRRGNPAGRLLAPAMYAKK